MMNEQKIAKQNFQRNLHQDVRAVVTSQENMHVTTKRRS